MTIFFSAKTVLDLNFKSLLIAFGLLSLALPQDLTAQRCQAPDPYRSPAAATSGETRALVVFVQFADDRLEGDHCLDHRLWKDTRRRDRIPGYAEGLISDSSSPPFDPFSITHYFHEMSNGALTFYGDVYPKVIHSEMPTTAYHRGGKSGYGYLIKEVLEKIDGDVNFNDYDTNPCDGVVDQIIIVIRRDPAATFTGVANLFGADKVAGRPRDRMQLDGVVVDWNNSGSILIHHRPGNVFPKSYMVRLLAHEYGHHLWNSNNLFRGHLGAIRNNKTPANGSDRLGYILMAGRGGGRDSRGDMLISSFERDLIGWNEPVLADTSQIKTYTLNDYYSSGDVLKVPLASTTSGDYSLYLDNRQRVGPYDQYYQHRKRSCNSYELGFLRTTGLLSTLVHESRGQPRLDVLAADDEMRLSNDNKDYDGDLFGSATKSQLSPFTKPALSIPSNISTWSAVDNIRTMENGQIQFDVVPDFRSRPIIREASWITAEHDSLTLDKALVISNGSELQIEDARIFLKSISLETGTQLIIGSGAHLSTDQFQLSSNSTLRVSGTLEILSAFTPPAGSRVIFEKGAVSKISGSNRTFDARSVLQY